MGKTCITLMSLAVVMLAIGVVGGETKRYQAATVLWSGMHGICSMAVTGKLGIIIS